MTEIDHKINIAILLDAHANKNYLMRAADKPETKARLSSEIDKIEDQMQREVVATCIFRLEEQIAEQQSRQMNRVNFFAFSND